MFFDYLFCDDNDLPKRGWTEFDYAFSGYTLADIYQAKDWDDDEKYELYQWITENSQKLKIETPRRRLVENQDQPAVKCFSAPNSLYSTLLSRLESLPDLREVFRKAVIPGNYRQ